jgi:EAL domain-containing protein (putative c-di-GMP-specific phosphodiesterase class I)
VVVQGIRALDDGRLVALEALTRGPAGPFAMPSDLFRAAFEQNVLTTLDLRALRLSLERRRSSEWTGWYHVNLFPSTLLNTPPSSIAALLAWSGPPTGICIELSEQQFLGDPAYLRPPLDALRTAGFRIAIDDVGFGRSSVEALMLLEPDVVKIDRRCIRSIGSEEGERRQLERLLAMLRAVEATVIVEGIETEEELQVLRELGVPYGQGFLWGEPRKALPEEGEHIGEAARASNGGARDVRTVP